MRTRSRVFRALGLLTGSALVIAACSTGPDEPAPDDLEREVTTISSPLVQAEVDDLSLPFAFQELPTYSLPFDTTPLVMDGVLFGLAEHEGALLFTAVDTDGRALWSVERPATCSGFTLTRDGDTPLAVLTNVESTSESLAQVTASAYDLHTGSRVWGPVPVSGPWHGPGTVFAKAAPPSTMGTVEDEQLLDPADGSPVDVEGRIVGEFEGTLVSVQHGMLTASGASTWQTPLADLGVDENAAITTLPGVDAPAGYALLAEEGGDEAALVNLESGRVLTVHASSAAWDPAAEVIVTTEAGTLGGYSDDAPVWNRGLSPDMWISTSGGVLTYLRSDSAVQVVNAMTGEDAVGYSPDTSRYAVPFLITPDGAGVFKFEEYVLVGTHPGP